MDDNTLDILRVGDDSGNILAGFKVKSGKGEMSVADVIDYLDHMDTEALKLDLTPVLRISTPTDCLVVTGIEFDYDSNTIYLDAK